MTLIHLAGVSICRPILEAHENGHRGTLLSSTVKGQYDRRLESRENGFMQRVETQLKSTTSVSPVTPAKAILCLHLCSALRRFSLCTQPLMCLWLLKPILQLRLRRISEAGQTSNLGIAQRLSRT